MRKRAINRRGRRSSGISLLEVIIAHFSDERGWSRRRAVLTFGTLLVLVGIPCALSNGGPLTDFKILGLTAFDFADYLSFTILLPVGGFELEF